MIEPPIEIERYPLPEGVEDALLNKTEIAGALRVSVNTVDKWVRAGCPFEEEGTNGQAYVFRLAVVWAWKSERDAAERERRLQADRAARQLQQHFLGLDEGTDRASDLTHRDRRDMAQSELVYMQAAQRRRELVQTSEVAELLEAVLGHVRDFAIAMPDRLAREMALSPEQTERVIAMFDEALEQLRDTIEEAELEERLLDPELEARPARLM